MPSPAVVSSGSISMTTDPEKAIEFYTKVVGWGTTQWEGPSAYTMWTNATHADRRRDGAATGVRRAAALARLHLVS